MKKKHGRYCKICGEIKANEKFSGSGHANHICKTCHSLPLQRRNELQIIRKIDGINENFFVPKTQKALLSGYSKDERYPEAREYAKIVLEELEQRVAAIRNSAQEFEDVLKPITFTELNDEFKQTVNDSLNERISEFIDVFGYLPRNNHKAKILNEVCMDFSEEFNYFSEDTEKELIVDDALRSMLDFTLAEVIKKLESSGITVKSYAETLIVTTTDRLVVRRFSRDDVEELYDIMRKPEIMYAWEHGFSKNEVRKWINLQLKRYKNDGYGYFALVLQDTSKIIGQVGLIKTEINGSEITELGYILDDAHWGNGYATEGAKACIKLAFETFRLKKLCCTIRPENLSAVKVAVKLGFDKQGEYIKPYKDKEMLHHIYVLES